MLQITVANRPTRGAGIGCYRNVKSKTDLSLAGLLRMRMRKQKRKFGDCLKSRGMAPIPRIEVNQMFNFIAVIFYQTLLVALVPLF